jgi:NAD(P)-dependent dehydrogenase (short-subunit alcohol dehydrogenase family)
VFAPDALSDRHVLITGGGSGLGLAMARRFAELGARVFITGRSEERLEDAARTIGVPDRVAYHSGDVRDRASVEAVVNAATKRFGRIDTLINNAAGNFRRRRKICPRTRSTRSSGSCCTARSTCPRWWAAS